MHREDRGGVVQAIVAYEVVLFSWHETLDFPSNESRAARHHIFERSSKRKFKEYSQAQRRALYAPRPEYRSAIGPGMVFSHVKFVRMGTVASVDVLRSTGHQMLDQAAIMAFRQWRFSPEI